MVHISTPPACDYDWRTQLSSLPSLLTAMNRISLKSSTQRASLVKWYAQSTSCEPVWHWLLIGDAFFHGYIGPIPLRLQQQLLLRPQPPQLLSMMAKNPRIIASTMRMMARAMINNSKKMMVRMRMATMMIMTTMVKVMNTMMNITRTKIRTATRMILITKRV